MRKDLKINDIAAWKVVKELVDHTFPNVEFDEKDFHVIYRNYINSGGLWEKIMNGEPSSYDLLSSCIRGHYDNSLKKIAMRILYG